MFHNRIKRWQTLSVLVGIVTWIIFNLWGLEKYMVPSCDEAHYSAAAYTVLTTGKFGMPMMENIAGVKESYIVYGRLLTLGQALTQLVFGPTLFGARLFSLIGLTVVVLFIYLIGTELFGHQTGIWAAILTAVQWPLFIQSHSGRPEMWLSAASLFSFYLTLKLQGSYGWKAPAAAGFITAILIDVHLNGSHFLIATSLIAIYFMSLKQRRHDAIIIYAVSFLLGITYFILVHIFPDPALAINQYLTLIQGERYASLDMLPLSQRLIDLLKWLYETYISNFSGAGIILSAFYVIGALGTLTNPGQRRNSILLLFFIVTSLMSFAIVNVYKPDYYAVIWKPYMTLLGVAGLFSWINTGLPFRAYLGGQKTLHGFLILLTALMIGGDIYLVVKYRGTDYGRYTSGLQNLMQSNKRVLADDLLWYGLHKQQMISSTYFAWVGYVNHSSPYNVEMIRKTFSDLSPDYVILDEYYGCAPDAEIMTNTLRELVNQFCSPIGSVSDVWLGTSTVYQCSHVRASQLKTVATSITDTFIRSPLSSNFRSRKRLSYF